MIWAALLFQTPLVPAPVTTAAASDDVVVIGERLKKWAGQISSNPIYTRRCTTVSTGDARIDAVGCRAMEACWPAARPGLRQAQDKHLAAADRERVRTATETSFGTCLKAQRSLLIADLVAHGTVRDGVYQ